MLRLDSKPRPTVDRLNPMAAPQRNPPPEPPLRLFDPSDFQSPQPPQPPAGVGGAHRTTHPVRGLPDAADPALFPVEPPDLAAHFHAVASAHEDRKLVLSDADRQRMRESYSAHRFFCEIVAPWRIERVQAKRCKQSTANKERQVVGMFDAWDTQQRSATWPAHVAWPGLPLGFTTGVYLERFFYAMGSSGLAPATLESRWAMLRGVYRLAEKLRVIDETPAPDLQRVIEELARAGLLSDPDDDIGPTSYTEQQLGAAYDALAGRSELRVELQVAWCLGANAGPRSLDLFSLRWMDLDLDPQRPAMVSFTAVKTKKRHRIPLAPVIVAQLDRLRRGRLCEPELKAPLFPHCTSIACKDRERSRAARRRTDVIKAALNSLGIDTGEGSDFNKPVQVLRSTCHSRSQNHRPGVGRLITHGPDADVSGKSYWDSLPLLTEAVNSIAWPQQFIL